MIHRNLDKFYTNPEIVNLVISKIKQFITITEKDLIIEPSAGSGVFIESIKKLSKNYIFLDIHPENTVISQGDYTKFNYTKLNDDIKVHVIGNPPFGKQSSLALKFIKHSCIFSDTISFILPLSFKKQSMQNKIPLNFHLIYELELPLNSFTLNDKIYNVPCVFQIHVKKDTKRTIEKLNSNYFEFVKREENPCISLRRVGFYTGEITTDYLHKSTQSHYFIKFNNEKYKRILLNNKDKLIFECRNYTVGSRSISKQDVFKEFNELIEKNS